jgi:hypothetical protein
VIARWGVGLERDAIDQLLLRSPALEWDTKPPKDLKESAEATTAFGNALSTANAALAPYGLQVDAIEFANQFGVPVVSLPAADTDDEDDGDVIEVIFDEDDQEFAEAA